MQPIQLALTMGIAASAQDAKMRRTKARSSTARA